MRSIQDFGHLLDLDKLYCQHVLIMWMWQLPFNRIWKCVVGHQRRRCRARTTRLRGAKFEKWFRIRALSRSGGQQLLSADELCDTPPGVLFQYSRGAGQAPPRESRLYHFRALKGSRPALLLPAQRKWRRREVYPAPKKRKHECGVCIIYFKPDQRGAGKAPHKGHITSSLTRFSYNCRREEKSAKFRGSSQCGPWWILQHVVPRIPSIMARKYIKKKKKRWLGFLKLTFNHQETSSLLEAALQPDCEEMPWFWCLVDLSIWVLFRSIRFCILIGQPKTSVLVEVREWKRMVGCCWSPDKNKHKVCWNVQWPSL